jgi:hypothetical protein
MKGVEVKLHELLDLAKNGGRVVSIKLLISTGLIILWNPNPV